MSVLLHACAALLCSSQEVVDSPVLRGLLGNQVLIVVDGVRLNDSTTRLGPNQGLNTIDPAIVDRVEVHDVTSSVLHVSDAIGGVIAIWTKRRGAAGADGAPFPGIEGSIEVQHDTATDGWQGSLELSGTGPRHDWVGIVSGGHWDDLVAGGGDEQEFTKYGARHVLPKTRTSRVFGGTCQAPYVWDTSGVGL